MTTKSMATKQLAAVPDEQTFGIVWEFKISQPSLTLQVSQMTQNMV